ncbi:MAG: radical SAM protein [Nitrososphaerales archaeon]
MSYNELVHIAWQCTYDCNLECIHCYAANDPHKLLSTKQAKNLIKQASELGTKSFVFTGGEPLLRCDLLELVAFTRDSGMTPIIVTNATLINFEHIKLFNSCKASLAINLPALREEVHMNFTKVPSSLSKKLRALDFCLDQGLSISIGLAITSINIDEAEQILEFARSKGVPCDVLATIPMGRARLSTLPKPYKYKLLMNKLLDKWYALPMNAIDFGEFSKVSVYEPSYTALMSSKGFKVVSKLCSLSQTMHIMEDGSVRSCLYIPYSLGNVTKNSLTDIWLRSKKDKFLQKLCDSDRVKGKCGKCSFKKICGGCRARAYWIFKDYFAEDKVCILNHS